MGSVKDLKILTPVSEAEPGLGRFIFSDRYSVFDWGEMPDHITNKGKALCLITAYFFEKLKEAGIRSHYRGVIENNQVKPLSDLQGPVAEMEVSLVRILKPEYLNNNYDYNLYQTNPANCLIPLEIIYRNTLPIHSSFRKRVQNGEIDVTDYGLNEMPPAGEILQQPIYDVSTKLETTDRYISWEDARQIAGLDEEEYQEIKKILSKINTLISKEVGKADLRNLDGKIELAFDPARNLMVVDAIGTPDECRFSFNGYSISKEAIRKFYRGSEWHEEVNKAKGSGPGWRETVKASPEPLPEEILKMVSEMYMSCANEITGKEWFKNIPPLTELRLKLLDEL